MTRTLTVVLWEDRHADPSVHLFTDRDRAIEWAREQGHDSDRHGEYEENFYVEDTLTITYSCEGDSLTVMPVEVDADALTAGES